MSLLGNELDDNEEIVNDLLLEIEEGHLGDEFLSWSSSMINDEICNEANLRYPSYVRIITLAIEGAKRG